MKRYLLILLLILAISLAMPLSVSADSIYARDITMLSDEYVSNGVLKLKAGEKRSLAEELLRSSSDRESYPVGTRTWVSSKPEIVSVSESGTVTALQEGTAKITVVYGDNHARIITSSIRVRVEGEAVPPSADAFFTINEGKAIDLQQLFFPGFTGKGGETVRWSTDKEFTAAVSANGVLEAKRYGTCTVTALYTDKGGSQIVKTVSVKVIAAHHDTLNKASIALEAGQSIDIIRVLYPEVSDSTYRYFNCISRNSGIAEVGADQKLTAKKAGSCTVTIKDTFLYDTDREITIKVKVYGAK